MRLLITTLLIAFSLNQPFVALATESTAKARLLVSNPSPYLGEEIDLLLEVTYDGHPGGRTRFNWPNLDNFVSADLTAVRSQSSRDGNNRLSETIIRRIKPLTPGPLYLHGANVRIGNQRIELPTITLRVRPLPVNGRPDNFNDQIGTYRLMLAATGTGPREINLHIYDSNLLSAVPSVHQRSNAGGQLIPIDVTTRAAGRGREHILRYFYTPAAGEDKALRFSLPVYDPLQQTYLEVETGPTEGFAARPAVMKLIILALFGATFLAVVLLCLKLRQHPRTISGCLQRFCRRPIIGLSQEKLQEYLQPYLNQIELEALQSYWRDKDSSRFNQYRSTEEIDCRQSTKHLRKSLWKAIDKQQNIT